LEQNNTVPMPRYKLTIEYNGSGFVGWQRQRNGPSVQVALENAISKFSDEKISFVAAGRTDAGVHALGMVVHFDMEKYMPAAVIQGALNYHARSDKIAIIAAEEVSPEFHARFSAKSRMYFYKILNRRAPSAIHDGFVWHIKPKLDTVAMHEAAQLLVGKHDFASFRSVHCQAKSSIKTIEMVSVEAVRDDIVELFIEAPSFMRNQVRIIMGCLVKVGIGDWQKEDLQKVIDARSRLLAAQTAPAHGLYFYCAKY